MFLKFFLPKTSGIRFKIIVDKKSLNLIKFKKLFFKKKNNSGRNNTGQITVRHKGSGIFNFRRKIDFFKINMDNKNKFISYDIDKKYSIFLGLIKYENGSINYILAPNDLKKYQSIYTSFNLPDNSFGCSAPLGWIKNNTVIYNIESKPNCGGRYSRSAGTFSRVIFHTEKSVLVKLPSKKLKFFSKYSLASIGRSSNLLHFLKKFGKAGAVRYLNIRPTVRGETMNPIDHPNGGRTRGGKPRKNPWGKIIK